MTKKQIKKEKKDLFFQFIKEATQKYFKNLNLGLPYVFLVVIVFILTLLLRLIPSAQPTQLNLIDSLARLFIVAIFFLILIFSSSFLVSGAIGMAHKVLDKKKASIATLFKTGKRCWLRMLGASIIILLIVIIVLIILSIPTGLLFQEPSITQRSAIALFVIIIMMLILAFFILSPYIIVIRNLGVFASIKENIRIARKNYLTIFWMTLIFAGIWALINLIPYVGQVINLLLIAPIQTLAFVILLTEIGKIKQK